MSAEGASTTKRSSQRSARGGGHRFLVHRPPRPPIAWQPPAPTAQTGHDVAYFGHALSYASRALAGIEPLTFILTWDLERLPEYGEHVVAIVQGDEDARLPAWSTDVLISFKCYGSRPPRPPLLWWGRPGALELAEAAHFARRSACWLPGAARRLKGRWGRRPPARILAVPLGYYNQRPSPMLAPGQRKYTVGFAGSGTVVRRRLAFTAPPKEQARARMIAALRRFADAHPGEPVAICALADFPSLYPGADAHAREIAEDYSRLLAQTKIALVPRGNSPETFRFFEAMRAGCVVVCDWLPEHWFYQGAPAIMLRRWEQLPALLERLLADGGTGHSTIDALHHQTLRWWETRCSERALGHFIATHVRLSLLRAG